MARHCVAAWFVLGAAGCDLAPTLGEQCVFGCQVQVVETENGTINVCHPEMRPCAAPYYCSGSTNHCETPTPKGQPCGEQCEEGLYCRFDGICEDPGIEDEICLGDGDCVEGLGCNFGVVPGDEFGRCKPVQGEGGPCSWHFVPDGGNNAPVAYTSWGCDTDLVCTPLAREMPDDLPADALPCEAFGCGYAGTCQRPGRAQRGDFCLENRACVTAQCWKPPLPEGLRSDPRFWCTRIGDNENCYAGQWPGTCIDDTDGVTHDLCGREGDPRSKECAAPQICSLHFGCQVPYANTAICSLNNGVPEGAPPYDERVCALGQTCVPGNPNHVCQDP